MKVAYLSMLSLASEHICTKTLAMNANGLTTRLGSKGYLRLLSLVIRHVAQLVSCSGVANNPLNKYDQLALASGRCWPKAKKTQLSSSLRSAC